MYVEVWNRFLAISVSAVPETTVNCISPSEIVHHHSLCDSLLSDAVVKCASWEPRFSSLKWPFFEAHLWHVTWAGISVSISCEYCTNPEMIPTVSLEEEMWTWASSGTSWQSFLLLSENILMSCLWMDVVPSLPAERRALGAGCPLPPSGPSREEWIESL